MSFRAFFRHLGVVFGLALFGAPLAATAQEFPTKQITIVVPASPGGAIEALVDGVRPLSALAIDSLREEVLRLGTIVEELHLLAMADLQPMPCHFADEDAVRIVARGRCCATNR